MPTPYLCRGDCNHDGAVTVNELVAAMSIALGNATASWCSVADVDGDGVVTIDELVKAVIGAVRGCVQL